MQGIDPADARGHLRPRSGTSSTFSVHSADRERHSGTRAALGRPRERPSGTRRPSGTQHLVSGIGAASGTQRHSGTQRESLLQCQLGVAYQTDRRDGQLLLEHPQLGSLELSPRSNRFGVAGNVIREIRFERASANSSDVIGLTTTSFAWSADASFSKVGI